jgi:hypothetical protein
LLKQFIAETNSTTKTPPINFGGVFGISFLCYNKYNLIHYFISMKYKLLLSIAIIVIVLLVFLNILTILTYCTLKNSPAGNIDMRQVYESYTDDLRE